MRKHDARKWSAMTRWLAAWSPGRFGLGQFFRGADQRLKQIDLIIRMHALHHGGDTFEAERRYRSRASAMECGRARH